MTAQRRPDASMSLLNDLLNQPVEGDYAGAAARRPSDLASRPQRLTRSGLVFVVASVLGLVLTGAVASLRAPSAAVDASRQLLVDELTQRTDQADALAAANVELNDEITGLQTEALAASDPALLAQLEKYELVSGAASVGGPGLVIVLTDAPSDGGEADPETMVQDIDLQLLVNGLWAAGAEAIGVNGERLTALSAIRNANQAILVDYLPLASPYTVEAVGDPQAMQTAFAQGSAASHLALLQSTYGIGVSFKAAPALTLPSAGGMMLRHATVPDVASSDASDDQEGTS